MQLESVFGKIKQSAKLKLDWFEFEDDLIDFAGTEKGSLIAENVLTEALGELSFGKKTEEVAVGLNVQFHALGVQTDVGPFVVEVEQKCKEEIDAFVHVRTMNMIGAPVEEIFDDLKPRLRSISISHSPTGEERLSIKARLIEPIMESGRSRFNYEIFEKRAGKEDSEIGEVRLGRVFERILALSTEIDESKVILKVLKKMMKPNSYPSWLSDLVDATIKNCKREKQALMAMNIAFCKGLTIDEIERLVIFRLSH